MRRDTKLPLIALLGATAALLSACGGSGAGLIPAGNAGPLRSDFEAVAAAAESGNGNCSATQSAIEKTESDFASLPSGVDARLRRRLSEGIDHLRSQALLACKQPSGGGTTTLTNSTASSSIPTSTSTTTTTSTSIETNETASSSSSSSPNGGTPAEGGEGGEGNPGGVGPNGEGPPGHDEHGGAAP